jgi:hypothetical protein
MASSEGMTVAGDGTRPGGTIGILLLDPIHHSSRHCHVDHAMGVRRLHDTDRSGWWWLIGFIPLIGIIVLIVFGCFEGTRGPNRFGPDPLAAPDAA